MSNENVKNENIIRDLDPKLLTLVTENHVLAGDFYTPRVNDKLSKGLVESVKNVGIRVPVMAMLYNPDPTDKTKRQLIVIDGRQRTKAAQYLVGKGVAVTVPTRVIPYTNNAEALQDQIIANNIRYADTFFDKAIQASHLVATGMPQEQVAQAFNVTYHTVRNWVEALSLPKRVQQAINDDKISVTAALGLTKKAKGQAELSEDQILERFDALQAEGKLSADGKKIKTKDVDAKIDPTKSERFKDYELRILSNRDTTPKAVQFAFRVLIGAISLQQAKVLAANEGVDLGWFVHVEPEPKPKKEKAEKVVVEKKPKQTKAQKKAAEAVAKAEAFPVSGDSVVEDSGSITTDTVQVSDDDIDALFG